MKREDLERFSNEDKEYIMSLYGKAIAKKDEEIKSLNELNNNLQTKIDDANKTIKSFEDMDVDGIKKELQSYKDKEAQEEADKKAKEIDEAYNKRIETAFGDSQFINELTKKQLITEMKSALKDELNVGKSDVEIFNALTKDQPNIFVNPNQPANIPKMGNVDWETTKDTPMFW